MWDLKSILTLIIAAVLCIAFGFTVYKFADSELTQSIVSTFLTIATSTIGFYIGYQTNKSKVEGTKTDVKENSTSDKI